MPFNPNEHMMQLKSKDGPKDYLPVQFRLVWFREACPDGTIETEEVEVDLDRVMEEEVFVWNSEKRRSEKVVKSAKGYARFRAVVTDGRGGSATGTKSECAASFADYIEKAETGAVGRALAMLGYGTAFAPELSEDHRIVDSPVDRGGVKPSEVEELKAYIGGVFSFKQENYDTRWQAYKVHVFGHPIADPDLTPEQMAKMRATADEKARE